MSFLKKHAAKTRIAAVIALSAVSFTACATNQYVDEKFAAANSRIDQLDARVTSASQRADAAAAAAASSANTANSTAQGAATDARTANQRLDQLTGRVDALEKAPAKKPRG
ncbi:MAG: hypothetical protein ABMA14_20100 [Hyphomonadaceae bacterium]